MGYPYAIGETVYLRAVERDDIERCLRWINDPEVTRFLVAGRKPATRKRQEEWIDKANATEHEMVFAICLVENDLHIGNCGLHEIDPVDRRAVVGILIGERSMQSKGHGTAAMRLLLDHAFETLNLERVQLSVYSNNPRAQRVYERLGFKHEGVLRKNRYKRGEYVDEIVMGLLRAEWSELTR
jgi:RimJ/RimL family protein N-acetyltransferase